MNPLESHSLLYSLEELPSCVVGVSVQGHILFANSALAELFGYRSPELTNISAQALFPENDFWSAPCIEPSSRILTLVGKHRHGAKLLLQARLSRLNSGGSTGVMAVMDDVTALKRAEEELRTSQARFAGILEIAEDAIVSVDADQRIILFNHGAEKIFGYGVQEVIGQPLEMLLPQRFATNHRQNMEEFAQSGRVSRKMGERKEIFGRRKDGTEFPAEASISRLQIGGQMIFTAMLRDVTERKKSEAAIHHLNEELEQRVAERTKDLEQALAQVHNKTDEIRSMTQQLWQAAKLASVGELAASIAHELNNPLATVSLRVESLLAQIPQTAPYRRLLEVVEQEVERMGSLVANLLQFSRRGHEQVSTMDVCTEIRQSLELVQYHLKKRGITVQCECTSEGPFIHADRQKLRQVFLNLITNATDAMPKGGTLTVRVHKEQLASRQAAVSIEFSDTGVGIAPEYLSRVMEPFFTTKEEGKGTGLGLAICRRVIQEHQGSMQIQSQLGKGTTVWMSLPIMNASNVEYLHGQ